MSALIPTVAREAKVLIVGTGLTGSLSCYHLRASTRKRWAGVPLRIDVVDMARGPGGRMSTTRFGPSDTRANTGAQYLSAFSPAACALLGATLGAEADRVPDPVGRTTHFALRADGDYAHWLPRGGTNAAVKKFLYGGEPDRVVFGSRLQRVAVDQTCTRRRFVPLFDSGGTAASYDVMILALPPKDIIKFFNDDRPDAQSQADLHRRTNRGRSKAPLPAGHASVSLPPDVLAKLRGPSYVGRYSLALWFEDPAFADRAARAWATRPSMSHPVLDMVSAQPGGVLVAQSTVALWRRLNNSRGGGRQTAKASIVDALEALAGGNEMPRPQHAKLLNWRTSQTNGTLPPSAGGGGVVTAKGGRLVFTGDWCFESSFEGCNLAAQAAAAAAIDALLSAPYSAAGPDDTGGGTRTPVCESARSTPPPVTEASAVSVARGEGPGHVGGKRPAPPRGGERGRVCSGPCGVALPRSKYSKTQWGKPEGSSRCKDCVAASTNPGSSAGAGADHYKA